MGCEKMDGEEIVVWKKRICLELVRSNADRNVPLTL